jgi:hypothetical protein
MFFKKGPYRADPRRSAECNRGAYLVDGLGHCGRFSDKPASSGVRDEFRAARHDQRRDDGS